MMNVDFVLNNLTLMVIVRNLVYCLNRILKRFKNHINNIMNIYFLIFAITFVYWDTNSSVTVFDYKNYYRVSQKIQQARNSVQIRRKRIKS